MDYDVDEEQHNSQRSVTCWGAHNVTVIYGLYHCVGGQDGGGLGLGLGGRL